MPNNRELLAKNIIDRFVASVSGTDKDQWLFNSPEDRVYVGKLSPVSAESSFSSSVLIKQISVDFRIPKGDIDVAVLRIYPQGNFFFRVLPTLEQQREFFLRNLITTFKPETPFADFATLAAEFEAKTLTAEMNVHKVQLLPVYEKIAIDRKKAFIEVKISEIYNPKFDCGSVPSDAPFFTEIKTQVEVLCAEAKARPNNMPCQFRDNLTIENLLSQETWQAYIQKQCKREEFDMFLNFGYSMSVDLKGGGDYLNVTVALSNETAWGDESAGFGQAKAKTDKYRINTLFNSGIKVKCFDTEFIPIELDYFADDYKYDHFVYALGNNCNVDYDKNNAEIQTTHVPYFIQHRLKTNDKMAIKFCDLIADPIVTLKGILEQMQKELHDLNVDFERRRNSLTNNGVRQFKNEIEAFKQEMTRFATGIDLLSRHNMVYDAFRYMNQSFMYSAKNKGYESWRLFQIVFIVSLMLDIVAHEQDLMLDDDIKIKAKTDDVDILYFPTGGGKTEAFLGILVFNLFFDRLRGKNYGVTAILKYPLRLLSVQQVQRVSDILANADLIRQSNEIGGSTFSLGYYVGDRNTPNNIDKELQTTLLELSPDQLDENYRLIDVCPFCRQESINVIYDTDANSL
jgi:hypothetical protein